MSDGKKNDSRRYESFKARNRNDMIVIRNSIDENNKYILAKLLP